MTFPDGTKHHTDPAADDPATDAPATGDLGTGSPKVDGPAPTQATSLRGRFQHGRPAVLDRSADQYRLGAEQRTAQDTHPDTGTTAAVSNETTNEDKQTTSDEDVVRAGGSMAIATLISRITGFLRTVLIGSALGPAVASAFNTANTLPNLITELVLGAVLTSLVVPVLVRAEKEDPDRGAAFIRRLLTLTFTLTITITLISIAAAPLLVRMSLDGDGFVNIGMSSAFAYLVLPQIVFYAMFSVFMAVLNTKGVFAPGAWAPVVNNLVTLAVLGFYLLLPEDTKLQPMQHVTITDPHVLLLGLGTTAGVVVQALIMVPYLRKAGIDVRPLWGIDERLKSFGGMAVAIVVYVAISQVGFILNNRIASSASAAAPTIYMQAWQLLQVPYGVIGVTLLTAVMPRLSRNAADGDDKAVVKDLVTASKLTMLALVPIIVFFTAFGTLIARALFNYGEYDLSTADVLGWTISFSAFTLIPYALVLLHLRVFYAREEVWTPTFIIGGITGTKLALAYVAPLIASEPRLAVVLLGAANGFGFLAGAIIGDRLLRRSLGSLGFRSVLTSMAWAGGSALVGSLIAWQLDAVLARFVLTSDSNPWFMVRMAIAGVVFLLVTGVVLSRSKLPEVLMLGGVLGRFVPARFKRTGGAGASAGEQSGLGSAGAGAGAAAGGGVLPPEEFAARERAALEQMMSGQTMGAVGLFPPMAAGQVRAPKLVPGAPLLEGRYRLLKDYGGTPAARFWQARELATGDVVALTLMDPSLWNDPARAKDSMLRRTALLRRALEDAAATAQYPAGIAMIRRIIDAGSQVVVVAQWVEGSTLPAVAEQAPEPAAAATAAAALAEAGAIAHAADTAISADHRDRLRVSVDGAAFVAFPGVLPKNSASQDLHGIAAALRVLLSQVPAPEIPADLHQLYAELEDTNTVDLRSIAQQLRGIGGAVLDVTEDATPNPADRTGFGASPLRPRSFASAAILAFLTVAIVATTIAALLSIFGSTSDDAPITTDSIRQGAEAVVNTVEPGPVAIAAVREWLPADGRGTEDSPELAALAADGDPATQWQADSYIQPFGPNTTKSGVGLHAQFAQVAAVDSFTLEGLVPGTVVEFRLAEPTLMSTTLADGGELVTTRLADTAVLSQTAADTDGTATFSLSEEQRAALDATVQERADEAQSLYVWITFVPGPMHQASVGEIEVIGRVDSDATATTTNGS